MTANEKRQMVIDKYKTILGRNKYSQPRREYCYKKYSDGNYYSDCSSSVSLTYKAVFPDNNFGCPNTVGMYQSKKLKEVPVIIKNGQITNPSVLRIGDMILFAGTDSSRSYAGYVGHVEMIAALSGNDGTLYGHGSANPKSKGMRSYLKSRYNSKTSTKLGHKGAIKVVRFIQDDDEDSSGTTNTVSDENSVTITGSIVNVRKGCDTSYPVFKTVHEGDKITKVAVDGWVPVKRGNAVCWMSSKYVVNGKCTGSSVNVRKGPGTGYASVATAKYGDDVEVVETTGWIPIEINDCVYWVSSKYAA